MTEEHIFNILGKAVLMTLLLAGPPVICAVLLGLSVSLFQALTQLQEQSLSMAVKFVAVLLVGFVSLKIVGGDFLEFSNQLFTGFPKWTSR